MMHISCLTPCHIILLMSHRAIYMIVNMVLHDPLNLNSIFLLKVSLRHCAFFLLLSEAEEGAWYLRASQLNQRLFSCWRIGFIVFSSFALGVVWINPPETSDNMHARKRTHRFVWHFKGDFVARGLTLLLNTQSILARTELDSAVTPLFVSSTGLKWKPEIGPQMWVQVRGHTLNPGAL